MTQTTTHDELTWTSHDADGAIRGTHNGIQIATIRPTSAGYLLTMSRRTEWARHTEESELTAMAKAAEVIAAWTRRGVLAAALFLATLSPVSANTPTFEQPVFPTSAYLAGCDILTFEDGSRLAECPEDVARLAYDADGQMRPNAAGVPIRAPGWYIVS